jgi:hypothetical protein
MKDRTYNGQKKKNKGTNNVTIHKTPHRYKRNFMGILYFLLNLVFPNTVKELSWITLSKIVMIFIVRVNLIENTIYP